MNLTWEKFNTRPNCCSEKCRKFSVYGIPAMLIVAIFCCNLALMGSMSDLVNNADDWYESNSSQYSYYLSKPYDWQETYDARFISGQTFYIALQTLTWIILIWAVVSACKYPLTRDTCCFRAMLWIYMILQAFAWVRTLMYLLGNGVTEMREVWYSAWIGYCNICSRFIMVFLLGFMCKSDYYLSLIHI